LLAAWPPGGPPLVWTALGVGKAYSSVAVVGDVLYSMGERDDEEWVFALDARDGSELWATRTGGNYDNDYGGGPRSTPTVVDGRVYTLGPTGALSCLGAADGAIAWQTNVLERFDAENLGWGLSESPLVVGELLFVATGSAEGSVVAFDRTSGEIVWQSRGLDDRPSYASAIVVDTGDVRQLVYVTESAAVGIRLLDGRPLWRHEKAMNDVANCTTPIHHDGSVFVTSGYDTGGARLRLAAEGAGVSMAEEWFTEDMSNHHGGVVLLDGYLYGYSGDELTCIDYATGETRWRDDSVGKGSLVAADGSLYVLGEDSVMGLVAATPEGYREISRFGLGIYEEPSWGHPVVAGGRLFLRLRTEIRCYDIRG
jgi:outer membrane protein assembly factor BamB